MVAHDFKSWAICAKSRRDWWPRATTLKSRLMAEQGDSTRINLIKLREMLLERAVSDDLRIFCADLGVNYEEVVGPNDKLPIAIINVVKYFDARGRTEALVARARREFQVAAWAEIYTQVRPVFEASAKATGLATVQITPPSTTSRAPGPLRVFLCHAKEDKRIIRDLYRKLKEVGFDPWLDQEKLLPGQKWQIEIPKAIKASDVVVACVSKNTIASNGFVKKELEFALDIADKRSEDAIFVIPARIQKCELPGRLADLHAVNLYVAGGQQRLIQTLLQHAEALRATTSPLERITVPIVETPKTAVASAKPDPSIIALPELNFLLELVEVPAGPFLMGSDKTKDTYASDNELPQHKITLEAFWIGKYPVTNAQYATYAGAASLSFTMPKDKENHPVVNVSWHEAMAFCQWLSKTTGYVVMLPSEAEWEKSARGTDGRIWPWDNTFDKAKANTHEAKAGDTTPVGSYRAKGDVSAYGCSDTIGNVWEWTRSLAEFSYPYRERLGEREDESASDTFARVLRGGSWNSPRWIARCAYRYSSFPFDCFDSNGFRCRVSL